jgi:ACS family D-galactonate transporter-like MFS transporter
MNSKIAPAAPSQAAGLADASRPTTVRWRIFLILLLLSAINYIDRASLSVALPLISSEFEMTPALEGLMLSAFFWSYALMQIPGGMLLDRFQVRNIVGVATVGWGFFQAIAGRPQLDDFARHPYRSGRCRITDHLRRGQIERCLADAQ